MSESHRITLLGTGFIGNFYTTTLHAHRRRDRVHTVCAATDAEAKAFASRWGIPRATTDMKKAVRDPETDLVVVALPNDLHKKAVLLAAEAGKAVLCTKPLARTAAEALLSIGPLVALPEARRTSSGLVRQQALFRCRTAP